ncbi:MAG: hypothetical protein ACOC2U_04405 [bacterium]
MKIFCIGLNKTATKSLTLALQYLNIDSKHISPIPFNKKVNKALRRKKSILIFATEIGEINYVHFLNKDVPNKNFPKTKSFS